jgi:hypothetical protein
VSDYDGADYARELRARIAAAEGHARLWKRLAKRSRKHYRDLAEAAEADVAVASSLVDDFEALHARVARAITWLVTVKGNQPASIIADRARLALKALRGEDE